ncbi:SMG7-like, partial [Olea europaea subsp. europaea]
MVFPMDDFTGNSSRERVQRLFKKNVELENQRRKAAQARIPSDPEAWQNMRENYENIILEDHAFSEQNDVEYAVWQLHYRRIEELRAFFNAAVAESAAPQNVKVPLRVKYSLPLDQFSDDPDNQISSLGNANKYFGRNMGLMSCHRCLIYLGDLARYKGIYGKGDSKARGFAAASSYYCKLLHFGLPVVIHIT